MMLCSSRGELSEVIFFFKGQELESEDNDRQTMALPGNQSQLINDAIAFSGEFSYRNYFIIIHV
jgi:hypothetical protein